MLPDTPATGNGGGDADPARNFADQLDADDLARVTAWHYGLDGEVHVTADSLERLEADRIADWKWGCGNG